MRERRAQIIARFCPEAKVRYGRQLKGEAAEGGEAAALKAGSAKHPCVHEIRVSTSDSCCWVVTVKQIMSAGGSGEIPLHRGRRRKLQQAVASGPYSWWNSESR